MIDPELGNLRLKDQQFLGIKITEKEFMAHVVELAKFKGWLVYHTYDSRRSEPGFPDLCMVRRSRLVFAELKNERLRLTDAQKEWKARLVQAGQEMYLWRPSDWDEIVEVLS